MPTVRLATKRFIWSATFYHIMQKLVLSFISLLLIAFLASAAQGRPNRIVLAYSATWRDADTPAETYNYDAITHLARAFLTPHPDGTIEIPDGYFNANMESLARKHGVKLLMSLGGEASNADNWLSIARNRKYFQNFCGNLEKLLADHGYDGIDIDWEPSAVTTEDGSAFVSFMKQLRAHFPDRIITTALGASEYWIGHFSWKEVTDSVDYVNVMTYDYSGGWGGRAAYASNLFPAGAYSPEPTLSVEEGMKNLIGNHKVSPAKLLMGMTFWPSRFSVDHIGDHFPINGPGYSMNITHAQAMYLLRTGKYADFWDEKAAMPYMERTGGGSVVCYESPKSIQRKCEYAAKLGCAGVMIWHVGADVCGEKAPLMDAVAESCGVAKQIFPRQIFEQQVSDLQNQIQQLKSQLSHVKAAGEVNSAKMSELSMDQLHALFSQMEITWGSLQDQLWRQDAPPHATK
jgi:chitinase